MRWPKTNSACCDKARHNLVASFHLQFTACLMRTVVLYRTTF